MCMLGERIWREIDKGVGVWVVCEGKWGMGRRVGGWEREVETRKENVGVVAGTGSVDIVLRFVV